MKLTPNQHLDSGHPANIPITSLWGVADNQAEKIKKLGIFTVQDILFHFPARYNDYQTYTPIRQVHPGQESVVTGTVMHAETRTSGRGMRLFVATISDTSGMFECVWFNQPYLAKTIQPGVGLCAAGKLAISRGYASFQVTDHEILKPDQGERKPSLHFGRLVPIYPETAGISSKWLRHKVSLALEYAKALTEFLPEDTIQRQNLLSHIEALRQIHFPRSWHAIHQARDRLAFEEMFLVQLQGLLRKQQEQGKRKTARHWNNDLLVNFLKTLPFQLTQAQKKVLNDILTDLKKPVPMRRLLEGDVGSGKTIVAAIAMLVTAKAGHQCTLMVPTEILAEQHFRKITPLLKNFGLKIGLMTSSKNLLSTDEDTKLLLGMDEEYAKVNRTTLKESIANGEIDIIIGTQALIQADITFGNIGLVIIDEQHRFGVHQRTVLQQKNDETPDFLMMSATPIPRSLALSLYGDLDLSIIDELPPGRQPIMTKLVPPQKKKEAYTFVRTQVQAGRQAFILCPLVEESEKLEATSAKQEYERLATEVFPDLNIGLLHGQMKPKEKDAVMEKFLNSEFAILVSTTVIEVGIDIPNATIMLIENAERFGLAQLHQLRGRVGRGEHQSYCLLSTATRGGKAIDRLRVFVRSGDGFKIAEADLQIRGPGEVYGIRQSGLPDFRMASLTDYHLIERTRAEAEHVLSSGTLDQYPLLCDKVKVLEEKQAYLH